MENLFKHIKSLYIAPARLQFISNKGQNTMCEALVFCPFLLYHNSYELHT